MSVALASFPAAVFMARSVATLLVATLLTLPRLVRAFENGIDLETDPCMRRKLPLTDLVLLRTMQDKSRTAEPPMREDALPHGGDACELSHCSDGKPHCFVSSRNASRKQMLGGEVGMSDRSQYLLKSSGHNPWLHPWAGPGNPVRAANNLRDALKLYRPGVGGIDAGGFVVKKTMVHNRFGDRFESVFTGVMKPQPEPGPNRYEVIKAQLHKSRHRSPPPPPPPSPPPFAPEWILARNDANFPPNSRYGIYMYMQFESIHGEIDDVEFCVAQTGVVNYRSGSRSGYDDHGRNAKRLDWFAAMLKDRYEWNSHPIDPKQHKLYFALVEERARPVERVDGKSKTQRLDAIEKRLEKSLEECNGETVKFRPSKPIEIKDYVYNYTGWSRPPPPPYGADPEVASAYEEMKRKEHEAEWAQAAKQRAKEKAADAVYANMTDAQRARNELGEIIPDLRDRWNKAGEHLDTFAKRIKDASAHKKAAGDGFEAQMDAENATDTHAIAVYDAAADFVSELTRPMKSSARVQVSDATKLDYETVKLFGTKTPGQDMKKEAKGMVDYATSQSLAEHAKRLRGRSPMLDKIVGGGLGSLTESFTKQAAGAERTIRDLFKPSGPQPLKIGDVTCKGRACITG